MNVNQVQVSHTKHISGWQWEWACGSCACGGVSMRGTRDHAMDRAVKHMKSRNHRGQQDSIPVITYDRW